MFRLFRNLYLYRIILAFPLLLILLAISFRQQIEQSFGITVAPINASIISPHNSSNAFDVNNKILIVSENDSEVPGNAESNNPSMSTSGQYIVFSSLADNLAPGDSNNKHDVFLRDVVEGTTECISLTPQGVTGNDDSGTLTPNDYLSADTGPKAVAGVSDDGRFVVFQSKASDLVPNDNNKRVDVFLRDRQLKRTIRITINPDGSEPKNDSGWPLITADGNTIYFISHSPSLAPAGTGIPVNIYRYNRLTKIIDKPVVTKYYDEYSYCINPKITPDGKFIVFRSNAIQWTGLDSKSDSHIFVVDLQTKAVRIASINSSGEFGNSSHYNARISPDGNFVSFSTDSTNYFTGTPLNYDVIRNMETNEIEPAVYNNDGRISTGNVTSISTGGRYVLAYNVKMPTEIGTGTDENRIVRFDRQLDKNVIIDYRADGTFNNSDSAGFKGAVMTSDGAAVCYVSWRKNAPDIDTVNKDQVFLNYVDKPFSNTRFPDGRIKKQSDTLFIGRNIFNLDGTNQTLNAHVPRSSTSKFNFRSVNMASTADVLNVTSTQAGMNWHIRYLDHYQSDRDVTEYIYGAGHNSLELGMGGWGDYIIEVTPDSTLNIGSTISVQIITSSKSDPTKKDLIKLNLSIGPEPIIRQPDMQIIDSTATYFNGNDIYNISGAQQGTHKNVSAGNTGSFAIKVQNDGNTADTFKLSAPIAPVGWSIRYYDAETGGSDITTQITGSGYSLEKLNVGEEKLLRLEVTPNSSIAINTLIDILVIASSISDTAKKDSIMASLAVAEMQSGIPDMLIKTLSETFYTGDDMFSNDGANQVKSQQANKGTTAIFNFEIQNDNVFNDSFFINAAFAVSLTGYTIRCYDQLTGGLDISSQVIGTGIPFTQGWNTGNIDAGQSKYFRIEITPLESLQGSPILNLTINARSATVSTKVDAVTALLLVGGQGICPDVLLKNSNDNIYIGDNIYNATGFDQNLIQSVSPGATTTCHIQVQNDGSISDDYILTSSSVMAGWAVHYYDALSGGTDITNQIIGTGWSTGELSIGGISDFRLEVTPSTTVSSNTSLELMITVKSKLDSSKHDTVKLSVNAMTTQATVDIVSVSSDEVVGNALSILNLLSANGKFVLFNSYASNLVADDTNGRSDLFVRDIDSGTTERVNLGIDGLQANGKCGADPNAYTLGEPLMGISGDGRYVVYAAEATNLVPDDTNAKTDIFLFDRQAKTTTRINVSSSGAQANGDCTDPVISADGRYIAYVSFASNIIAADANTIPKVLLYDRVNQTTERVCIPLEGSPYTPSSRGPSLSADGRFICFVSDGVNLIQGLTLPDGYTQVFVYDRQTKTTRIASVSYNGYPGNFSSSNAIISGDGQHVMFFSSATNLTTAQKGIWLDLYIHDFTSNNTERAISQIGGSALPEDKRVYNCDINTDGRYIVFMTESPNIVTNPLTNSKNIYLRDRQNNTYSLISTNSLGIAANHESTACSINSDGTRISFCSTASNIVTPPVLNTAQIYLRSVRNGTSALPMPDLHLKNATDTANIGDNIYSSNGANQIKYQSVSKGAAAVFHFTIQNDGSTADNFYINAVYPAPLFGYDIKVFDALTGGTDVMNSVFGAGVPFSGGWNTGTIEAGASKTFRMEVTPLAVLTGTPTLTIVMDARSATDATKVDAVTATISLGKAPPVQPDVMGKTSTDAIYTGDNVYNTSGANQTVAQSVTAGVTATYQVKVQNDGNAAEAFTLTAPAAGTGWTYRYYDALTAGTDITSQVTGAGWSTGSLAAGASRELRVEVTPAAGTAANSANDKLITATAASDATNKDAVLLRTTVGGTVTPQYQPDGQIKAGSDSAYIGDGVYNLDGATQSRALNTGKGVAAIFHIKVQNDGTNSDGVRVTAPSPGTGWTAKYYNAPTGGTDITTQVQGGGWTATGLATGASTEIRCELTPGTTIANGASKSVLITLTSTTDTTKKDAVLAQVTVATGANLAPVAMDGGATTTVSTPISGIMPAADPEGNPLTFSLVTQPTRGTVTIPDPAKGIFLYKPTGDMSGKDTFTFKASDGALDSNVATIYVTINPISMAVKALNDAYLIDQGNTLTVAAAGVLRNDTCGSKATLSAKLLTAPAKGTLLFKADGSFVYTPNSGHYGNDLFTYAASDGTVDSLPATVRVTTVKRQPDAIIRAIGDSAGLGDNIYNQTGAAQTRTVTTKPGQTVSFQVTLENESTDYDSLKVTAPKATGWTQRVIANGVDVTAEVLGAGWVTPVLAPGGTQDLWVMLTPSATLTNADYAMPIGAASLHGLTCRDVVKAGVQVQVNRQPDLRIRTLAEPAYSGDNVYNMTGENQTKKLVGTTGTYLLHVQNDGDVNDRLVVTGPAGGSGWTVQYLIMSTNADITSAVTNGGWTTPSTAPGAYQAIKVLITADSSMAAGAMKTLAIVATSISNGAKRDMAKASLQTLVHRADLLIKGNGETAFLGNDLYSADGVNQTKALTAGSQPAVYQISLENDGNATDSFTLRATASGAGWTAQYLNGSGIDVTTQLTSAGLTVGPLAPGASALLKVQVTATGAILGGNGQVITLTAVPVATPGEADAVRAVTTLAQQAQPDLKVRLAHDTAYTGDNLYNLTGEGQQKSLATEVGAEGMFLLHAQNDGNLNDRLIISAPAAPTGWTVRYFEMGSQAEITTQVTGSGWTTVAMNPGGYVGFYATAVPTTAAPGAQCSVLLTAVAQSDATKKDAVLLTAVRPVRYQPDVLLRSSASTTYDGDNNYGAGQTTGLTVAPMSVARYYFRIQNDGNVADTLTVTASAGGSGWTMQYFDMATNADITALITGTGWTTTTLQPGAYHSCWVKVTPASGTANGVVREFTLTAVSSHDAAKTDAVTATTTCQSAP